jgi:hypothetical protein
MGAKPTLGGAMTSSAPSAEALNAVEAASEADRAWFAAHPHRSFRIRLHLEGEWPHGSLEQPPPGWRWFTVVRQLAPGVRMRRPFPMEGEPGTGEHAASRIFAMVMRGGT